MVAETENRQSFIDTIYNDPKTGFNNIKKLYQLLKDKGYTYKEIHEYLKENEVHQMHKPKHTGEYFPIYGKKGTYQADLIFYDFIKGSNNNYGTFLTFINVNTKYAYVIPLKNKNEDSLKEAFQQIVNQTKINVLGTDNGKEFLNKSLKKLFDENEIEHYTADAGDHNKLGVIERFNRTIKGLINKWLTYTNKKRFIDVLPDLVYNYNNSLHSSINLIPAKVSESEEEDIIFNQIKKTKELLNKVNINEGDYVRIPIEKTKLDKEGINYSKEIYKVIKNNGLSISLEGVRRKYKPYELIKVSNNNIKENVEKPINQQLKEARQEKTRNQLLKREDIEEKNIIREPRIRNKNPKYFNENIIN